MATRANNTAEAGSVKNAIRWGLLLAAVGTVGFRVPRLVSEFREWRQALVAGDGMGAEGWQTVFKVDLLACLFVLAVGAAAFYLLRSRTKAAQ